MKRICLDVDGVLADWMGGVFPLFGRDPSEIKDVWSRGQHGTEIPLDITRVEMFERIEKEGHDWWANLEPFPWCDRLWELCNSVAPTILLTSTTRDPCCASGKLEWIQNRPWGGRNFRDYLIGPRKPFAAKSESILIDDTDIQIEKFREAGGKAILFPQYWNSAYEIRDSGVDLVEYVAEQLASI